MHVKMTLTFPDETIETLKEKAKAEGFLSHNILARYLILRGLKNGMGAEIREEDKKQIYELALDKKDAGEFEAYVRAKRHHSVPDFAQYAMELAMSRAPLTEAQKRRVDTIDEK
jgi:hypothetical protein